MSVKPKFIYEEPSYDTRKNRVWAWSKDGKTFMGEMSQYLGSLESQPGLDAEFKKEVMLHKIIRFLGVSMSKAMPIAVSDYMVAQGFDEAMFFWLEKNFSKRKKAKSDLRIKSSLAPISLKVLGPAIGDEDEAYDENAINGDPGKDNTVQDGTPWERPAAPGVPAMGPAPRRSAVMRNARKVRARSKPVVAKPEKREGASLADRLLEDYNKQFGKFRKSGLVSDIESLKELGRIIQTHIHNRGSDNQALLRRVWDSENPEPVLTEMEQAAEKFIRTLEEETEDWLWDMETGFFADDVDMQELDKEMESVALEIESSVSDAEFIRGRDREVELSAIRRSKINETIASMQRIDDERLKKIAGHYERRDKEVAEQVPDISKDDEEMLIGLVEEINKILPKVAKYDGPSREESVAANGDLRPARQGLMPRRSVVEGVDRVLGLRSPEGFHLPVTIPVVDGGMDENGAVEHLAGGGALSEVPDDFLAQAIFENVLTKDDLQAEIDRAHQTMGYPGDPIQLTDSEFAPEDEELQTFLSNLAGTEQRSGSKVPGRFIEMDEIEGDGLNGIYMFYDRVSQQRIGIKYGTPKGKRTSYFANEDVNEVLAAHVAERLGFAYGSMRWGGPPPADVFPTRSYDPGARPIVFELLHNYSNRSGDPADALSLEHGGESGYPSEASADSLVSGLLLDLIIQNKDRHGGNFFTGETPSGDMAWFVPIDHGNSNMQYRDTIVKPDWMGGLTGDMVGYTKDSLDRVKQVLANEQAGISDSLSRADILVAIRAAQASLREADSALEINEAIGRILGAARFNANYELRRLTEGLASRLKEVTDIDPDDLLKMFENDRSV